jgi:hypothetical protein
MRAEVCGGSSSIDLVSIEKGVKDPHAANGRRSMIGAHFKRMGGQS